MKNYITENDVDRLNISSTRFKIMDMMPGRVEHWGDNLNSEQKKR